jgi:hypothetical protein
MLTGVMPVSCKEGHMGTTSDKIAKNVAAQVRSQVIDLSGYRAGREIVHEAFLDIDRVKQLVEQGYDPCHALYIYGQNLVSVLAEQISMMKEARKYAKIVGDAEDLYMPDSPPISPLTRSYFTMWAFFDIQFGQSRETMGTCILRIAEEMGFPAWMSDVIGLMQQSRMGFYVHCGTEGTNIKLRELSSQKVKLCHVPTGYLGHSGELWFVRLLPPVNALIDYHVVMTTPYVLIKVSEAVLSEYIDRELERMRSKKLPKAVDPFDYMMKHGPTENHWNEFIFCAYCNHQHNAIFLTGIPDIKESLPHA